MSVVSLVGAGPGDMGLISLKALDRVKKADVIVYDNLIPFNLLNEARLSAKLIYVGKKAGEDYLKQEEINKLLADLSKEYENIVRLKGGDPYVFGRGAEEALYLMNEGVDFELVSGVSSAVSAPASVGIPVTDRKYASSFHVITGHEADNKEKSSLEYEYLAKLKGTLVFMMGLGKLRNIVESLLNFGKKRSCPVSIVSKGSLEDKKRHDFTLGQLQEGFESGSPDFKKKIENIERPAVIVVGEAASLRLMKDEDKKLLTGKKILITGTRQMCQKMLPEIKKEGAEGLCLSLIETVLRQKQYFEEYINNISDYTHIVFTSSNGVDAFFSYLKNRGTDIRKIAGLKFAVIGKGTAQSLAKHGIIADIVPDVFTGEKLGYELLKTLKKTDRVVLFRARQAGKEIIELLENKGIDHSDVALYETIKDYRRKDELNRIIDSVDYITVTSGLGAEALYEMTDDRDKLKDKIISIGPVTSEVCKKSGLKVYKTAKEFTVEGMLESIKETLL